MSYIVVGGTATIVEWVFFWYFVYTLKWDQNIGLIVAYIISTLVNMLMGKMLTFRNASVVNETTMIYLVSALGCGLNLLFLDTFTYVLHMNSMLAKILVTGMMLFVNFFARKYGIYRESNLNPSSVG